MALEPLTPQQRSAALDKAFKARQVRAEVKAALKSGETDLAAVLQKAGKDEALAKMRVLDLLALPARRRRQARRSGHGGGRHRLLAPHQGTRSAPEERPVGEILLSVTTSDL